MPFIIMKKTRYCPNPTPEWGYRGPTCEDAGVEPGKVYETREDALHDCARLTYFNPVGFEPIPLPDTN